ncbi:MAG: FtsK/SpoIIIE domain-containing protein, partial [Chloroflexales bacterium]
MVDAPNEKPFDEVDFVLMLATAIIPPHWPFGLILGVTTIARRSPKVAAYLLDSLKMDAAVAPKWLLPGAAGLPPKDAEPAAKKDAGKTDAKPAPSEPKPEAKPEAVTGATLRLAAPADPVQAPAESLSAALAKLPAKVALLDMALPPSPTAIPLGIGPDGAAVWSDLATDTYHVGLYGQSGAGKDNLLRCWFVMLCRRNTPETIQFAILDGKGDWLIPQLANLGHMFIAPAGGYGKVGDKEILDAVKWIDMEAQRRQELIRSAGVVSRDAYQTKTGKTLP